MELDGAIHIYKQLLSQNPSNPYLFWAKSPLHANAGQKISSPEKVTLEILTQPQSQVKEV